MSDTTPIFASDGAYTTEAAFDLPDGSPAMVFCSDGTYRLAMRATEPYYLGNHAVWRFADGKTQDVTHSTAKPVLVASIRDDATLGLIADALRFGVRTETRSELLEGLVARPVTLLDEPRQRGAIAIDANHDEWVRIAGEGAVWIGPGGFMHKTWRELRAVRIESHGHKIESTEDKA